MYNKLLEKKEGPVDADELCDKARKGEMLEQRYIVETGGKTLDEVVDELMASARSVAEAAVSSVNAGQRVRIIRSSRDGC